MLPKVIIGNRAQKMGGLGRTPEQEAQTSGEKGSAGATLKRRVQWDQGCIPRRCTPTHVPALARDAQQESSSSP